MVADDEKSITKVSFGTIGLSVGSVLLVGGFLGYFNFIPNADNSLSALLLIYGFPISLIGTARRSAGGAWPFTLTTPPPRLRAEICRAPALGLRELRRCRRTARDAGHPNSSAGALRCSWNPLTADS